MKGTGHKSVNISFTSSGQGSKLQFKARLPLKNKSKSNTKAAPRVEAIQNQEVTRHAGIFAEVSEVGAEGAIPIPGKKWMLAGAQNFQSAWLVFLVIALFCGATLMLLCCIVFFKPIPTLGNDDTDELEYSDRDTGWASPGACKSRQPAQDFGDLASDTSDDLKLDPSQMPMDHSASLAEAVRTYRSTYRSSSSKS